MTTSRRPGNPPAAGPPADEPAAERARHARTTARRLTRGALVLAVLGALVLGSFATYGWWSRREPVSYSRGGQEFGTAVAQAPAEAPRVLPFGSPAPSASGDPAATIATVPPAQTPEGGNPGRQPAAASTATSAAAPGVPTPAATTALQGPRPAPATPSPGPARAAAPAPGRYGLTVAGQENVRFGPLSFCEREMPRSATLAVAPAEGEPRGSYNFDVRYFPDAPGQHDERTIYRFGKDAVNLVFESAAVTCSGVRQASEVSHPDGQLAVRLPLRTGGSWSGTSGDAERRVSYRANVTGSERVNVDGRRFDTYVIETRSTFTGAEKGERVQRWWYSPQLAMPLRWEDQVTGSRSGATYSSRINVSVNSLPGST